MIHIQNLGKAYHQRIVLNIDQLTIPTGEMFGLVGNNGAGKTTLFRLILDLIKADKGEVHSSDWIVSKSEEWKNYTGSYIDENFLIDFLTPEEYFYFIGELNGMNKQDVDSRLTQYAHFFNEEIIGQKKKFIRDFSKGNKQKIGIISAILCEPKVVLLDEPFNSLDPSSQILLKKLLSDFSKRTGATILISSHDLAHITEICERIVLLEKGLIIRDIQNEGQAFAELTEYFSVE